MTLHLFRPSDPANVPTPPVGTCRWWQGARLARSVVTRAAGLLIRHVSRRDLCMVLLLLGGVVQLVLLAAAAYLIDMTFALMELWVVLARKHLELTL